VFFCVGESGKSELGEHVFVHASAALESSVTKQTIVVDVGLGVVVELTLDEAVRFVSNRENLLSRSERKLTQEISNFQAQLSVANQILTQLNTSNNSTP